MLVVWLDGTIILSPVIRVHQQVQIIVYATYWSITVI